MNYVPVCVWYTNSLVNRIELKNIIFKTKMDSELATAEQVVAGNNEEEPQIITKNELRLQKLEEKAKKAEEALAAEEKVRKELEVLNSKLLAEKTALLDSLAGEKGSLQEFQEKTAKLNAQKNDLDNQLRVSTIKVNSSVHFTTTSLSFFFGCKNISIYFVNIFWHNVFF